MGPEPSFYVRCQGWVGAPKDFFPNISQFSQKRDDEVYGYGEVFLSKNPAKHELIVNGKVRFYQ
jgi:hypothetical protein